MELITIKMTPKQAAAISGVKEQYDEIEMSEAEREAADLVGKVLPKVLDDTIVVPNDPDVIEDLRWRLQWEAEMYQQDGDVGNQRSVEALVRKIREACDPSLRKPRVPRGSKPKRVTAKDRLGHIDWTSVFKQMLKLKCWGSRFDRGPAPTITIRWGTKKRRFVSGRYVYGSRRITMTINADSRVTDVLETMLHEVTHAAGYRGHDSVFYAALEDAAREMWGTGHIPMKPQAWARDEALREMMDEMSARIEASLPLANETK